MKKILIFFFLSLISFNIIHAEITWSLSSDGTLTVSGEDMPNYDFNFGHNPNIPWYSQRDKIKKIIIENGVTCIGENAFRDCSSLISIMIPESVTSIGSYAFYNSSSFTSINIPNSVESIGKYAFLGCSSLFSITIPNSVTNIGIAAFSGCSSLNSITIPPSVICIDDGVWAGCSNLTAVTIPNSVTTIGSGAFSGCSSLSSVTISKSVRSIAGDAFDYCDNLSSIIVENDNLIYDSRDNSNAIIETKSNTLIVGCQNTIIPESVTSIGEYAFCGYSSLASITIPNSVTNIGSYAFYECTGLYSIIIPNSVTNIGYYALGACSNLSSITLLDGLKSIGDNAFESCTNLTSIIIPKSVKSIGYHAFNNCIGLTSLACEATVPPNCGYDCFSQINRSIPLYVPENSIKAYIEAKQWNTFANILPISVDPTLALTLTDKNSDLKKGYYQKGKVTLSRSNMSVGDYATFCLPFDIDISKTKDNFSKVYIPLNIGLLKPSGTLLLLLDELNDNSVIKAGQTFVAKCKKSDVVFENCADVTFNEATPNPNPSSVKIYNFDGVSGALTQNTDVKMKIGGSYSQLTNLDRNNYCTLFANGMFDATTSVTPFQMYVYMDGNNSLGSKVTSIAFEFNDISTDIKELQMTNGKSFFYDLNGRIVNDNVRNSGIYIRNGKKEIVK